MATRVRDSQLQWPELPLAAWSDTYQTLHLWLQIVGKVRLVASPWVNHSWHVTLYVTARGLTTSPIAIGTRALQIDFDFIDHRLAIQTSDGRDVGLALEPHRLAFYLYDLASSFHGHWNRGTDNIDLRFVKVNDRQLTHARLGLVQAVSDVLTSGLALIGAEAPTEMR